MEARLLSKQERTGPFGGGGEAASVTIPTPPPPPPPRREEPIPSSTGGGEKEASSEVASDEGRARTDKLQEELRAVKDSLARSERARAEDRAHLDTFKRHFQRVQTDGAQTTAGAAESNDVPVDNPTASSGEGVATTSMNQRSYEPGYENKGDGASAADPPTVGTTAQEEASAAAAAATAKGVAAARMLFGDGEDDMDDDKDAGSASSAEATKKTAAPTSDSDGPSKHSRKGTAGASWGGTSYYVAEQVRIHLSILWSFRFTPRSH